MRRIAFALVLMIVSGWAVPSRAQWWAGGWGRPCLGGCRPWGGGWAGPRRFVVLGYAPRPIWGGPDAVGPPRFRPDRWGWRRMLWRREMRWRRWADAERPRFHRWTRWRSPLPTDAAAAHPARAETADPTRDGHRGPNRAEAVVAMLPTGALHLARSRVHAAVLAAAAIRSPPARAAHAAPRPAVAASSPSADVRPVALRNQPAGAPAPIPAARSIPAPADVPVAPLD